MDSTDLSRDAEEARSWHELGDRLLRSGRAPEAISAFHRAMAIRVLLDEPALVGSTRRALDAASGLS